MIGLLGFAAIWGAGRYLALPVRLQWIWAGLWWAVLIAMTWPRWNALRELEAGVPVEVPAASVVGGDLVGWVALAVLTGAVVGYRRVLRGLRARLPAVPAALVPARMSEAELDRYSRHILLREIGGTGQRRLREARVLVVGAGGLGAPAILYLAAAGVGRIGVIDDDVVENSNLQRQIIHTDQRIGMPKVFSAQAAVAALNPHVDLRPYNRRLTADIAQDLIADHDLVLDGSDSFDTREMVNAACVAAGKPLVSGAITQWEGQVSLFHPAADGPCHACVFPNRPAPGMVPTCAEAGVVGPLPGIIGAIMATEAIKHLTGAGQTLAGRLMIHDALYAETRVIAVQRQAGCAVCGAMP